MLNDFFENKIEKINKANQQFYDSTAEKYLQTEFYAYTPKIVIDVTRLLKLSADSCGCKDFFLDLGCGSGFLSSLVFQNNLFKRALGVDISSKQVELFNKSSFSNDCFYATVGNAYNIQLENDSVDLIGGYSVLHHFYDYEMVLKECRRVIKIGGCLYFDFEPNFHFKNKLKFFINLRRQLIGKNKTDENSLENLAEFHNNFSSGIDFKLIQRKFSDSFELIKFGPRYPGTLSGSFLKFLSFFSTHFCPLFYFIFRRIK